MKVKEMFSYPVHSCDADVCVFIMSWDGLQLLAAGTDVYKVREDEEFQKRIAQIHDEVVALQDDNVTIIYKDEHKSYLDVGFVLTDDSEKEIDALQAKIVAIEKKYNVTHIVYGSDQHNEIGFD